MRSIIRILLAALIVTALGCTKNWDDHYKNQPATINSNVFDAIKERSELSSFVNLILKYKYDSLLFKNNNTYTLFIPNNEAFAKLDRGQVEDTTILNYLISKHFIQPNDIQGPRKLQTLAKKYSTFNYENGKPTYDDIELKYESPLYINGKFFIMDEVPLPRLNLYEYIIANNSYLKAYIDKQDSIILDKVRSKPIGFDAKGNTVYDTVSIRMNKFEDQYFPVRTEYRKWTATIVFPKIENYENGLTAMALKLGYKTYADIPLPWQENILIPHLLKHGIFLNMLEPSEFKSINVLTKKKKFNMVNIAADSIVVNYVPTDKYLCSNGYFYDLEKFEIPDSLFSGTEKMEGEWLARKSGVKAYKYRDNVTCVSSSSFDVANNYIKGVSNDSILIVNFTKGYTGSYKLQFQTHSLFPRKYLMVVHTSMDYGGIYDVSVNGVLVKHFDYGDYSKTLTGIVIGGSVTGANLKPTGRFNSFDCYVDIAKYGNALVTFDYKGPGKVKNNGLFIDVIEFLPVN